MSERVLRAVPARTVVWLRAWTLPLLVVLLAAVTLRLTLHAHWLDLVWSVRGLSEPTWITDCP